jgi:integrase
VLPRYRKGRKAVPTLKFKVRSLDALKPPAKRTDYWDENLPGFGLRLSPSGGRTWIAVYRHQGRLRRYTIGTDPPLTLADASAKAREVLRLAALGHDPAGVKQSERLASTVAELVDVYLERHAKAHKRSWNVDRRVLNRDVVPVWGSRRIGDIGRRDVIAWVDRLLDRGAPIMANRTFEVARKMFAFAVARDLIPVNPFHGVEKPAPEKAREKVLDTDEIRAVWKAVEAEPPLLAAVLKLRLITAQRGGEIRAMRWQDIDPAIEQAGSGAWWTIPGEFAKNGKAHRVWLSRPAIAVLQAIRTELSDPEWVFPGKVGPRVNVWFSGARVRTATGVDFVPHDLRRTAASIMTSMGITRLVVGKILNHTDPSVTKVYDRFSYDGPKQAALDAWAERLTAILENREIADNIIAFPASAS